MKKLFASLFLSLVCSLPLSAGVHFDGSSGSHLSISSSATDLTSNWTIAFWVYVDDTGTRAMWHRITNTSSGRQIAIYRSAAAKAEADVPFVATVINSTASISDVNWYHVCVTRSGNTWNIYLNGVVDATPVTNSSTQETGGTFQLGEDIIVGLQPLKGIMGEAAGWNVVLTADEIASLGKGTPPGMIRKANIVYYWPMYQISGDGTTVADLSGAKWNGTVAGTLAVAKHPPTSPPPGAR